MFRRSALFFVLAAALAACGGTPTDTDPDSGVPDSGVPDSGVPDAGGNDTVAPAVSATQPTSGATGVPRASALVISFSEPMDTATVQVTLSPAASLGSATWDTEHTQVTYAPTEAFAAGTTYTVTVTGKDLAGNSLPASATFTFTTEVPDTTAPTITATTPAAAATNVDVAAAFSVTFSEAMDTGTVTLDVSPTAALQLTWDATGTTLTALPTEGLTYATAYTVTVGGKDMAGNALSGTTTLSFTTANPPDTTPPEVTSSSPADAATAVSVATNVSLGFSESVDRLSVEDALTITPAVTCTFAWNTASKLVTCIPASPLAFDTQYTVTLGTGAKDLANNTLATAYSFSFRTAAAPDTTRPTITGSTPANGSRGNIRASSITVVFSEPMDKASAQTAFSITAPTGFNAGTFSWNTEGTEMTFNPDADFAYGTLVSWSVSTAAEDLAGNPLAASSSSSFRVAYLATRTLLASAGTEDGFVYNDRFEPYSPGNSTMWSGDISTGRYSRSFLGFNLGGLTGTVARINSATLYIYQSSTTGSPTTKLGTFWVQSVDYGTTLELGDFDTAVLQTYQCRFINFRLVCGQYNEEAALNVAATGQKSLDVTRKVKDDWANQTARGLRSQFRLKFTTDVTYDNVSDYVSFYTSESTTSAPYLTVEYEYE